MLLRPIQLCEPLQHALCSTIHVCGVGNTPPGHHRVMHYGYMSLGQPTGTRYGYMPLLYHQVCILTTCPCVTIQDCDMAHALASSISHAP
jgi:hypothetical protein